MTQFDIPQFEEIGSSFLFYEDEDQHEYWKVVLCFDEEELDMDGEFETAGQALDALFKWANDRNVKVYLGMMSLKKLKT